jgi:hypothetical protein
MFTFLLWVVVFGVGIGIAVFILYIMLCLFVLVLRIISEGESFFEKVNNKFDASDGKNKHGRYTQYIKNCVYGFIYIVSGYSEGYFPRPFKNSQCTNGKGNNNSNQQSVSVIPNPLNNKFVNGFHAPDSSIGETDESTKREPNHLPLPLHFCYP